MNLNNKKNIKHGSEIGYIILSSNLDRRQYIRKVINTNRCTVLTSSGTIYNECPFINKYTKDYLFPKEIGELGSTVILLFTRDSDVPLIVGKVPTLQSYDTNNIDNEFEHKEIIENDNCVIFMNADPENKQFNLGIFNKTNEDAEMNITVSNMNKNAKLNINIIGDLNIKSTNNVNLEIENELNVKVKNEESKDKFGNIKYSLNKGFDLTDEYGNKIITDDKGIKIESVEDHTIRMNNNLTSLEEIFNDLLKAIDNLTLKHPQGPTLPIPINKKEFDNVKDKIKKLMKR